MADQKIESGDIFTIRGRTGLNRWGGQIYEELHPKLRGLQAVRVYQEMRDNDPVIGAILFLIDMLIRQVDWTVEPASPAHEDEAAAEFLRSCLEDMENPWTDFVSEITSMFPFGWSYFEILYKRREGVQSDPKRNSRHADNRIGWRAIELRAQETLDSWDFDDDGALRGMWQNPPEWTGRLYIPYDKALLFRTKSFKNSPEGRSILRTAYRPWYFLKRIQEFEAIGVERYLSGVPVMEVPPAIMHPNASTAEKSVRSLMEKLVSEFKRDEREGVVIPAEEITVGDKVVKTGYRLRLLSAGGSQQIDTDKIIRRYESRIAMSVLAEFILLGTDKVGSFALASSKTNLFAVAMGAWVGSIAATLNRHAVPALFRLNGWALEKLPELVPGDIETPPLDELGTFLANMVKVGLIQPDEPLQRQIRRLAKLPEPEAEEPEVKAPGQPKREPAGETDE